MENWDIFEEDETTIAAASRKFKKYEALSLRVALQNVYEGTLSVYTSSEKYKIPVRPIS